MNYSKTISSDHLFFKHLAVLASGFLVGLFAVVIVDSISFDFSQELVEARSHGIVSPTILNGYPESRDILLYAELILLPTVFSLGAWLRWSKKRQPALMALFQDEHTGMPAVPGNRKLIVMSVVLIILSATFNINSFCG
jgi:hypothetical protein